MTLTGTFVLAYTHASDTLDALANAARLGTAALGLLLRYLTRPPAPGTGRGEVAAAYGLSLGQLRAGNDALTESGHLMQVRRAVGRGQWQHLIIVTDTPGTLPANHEAWVLLDAALAAEQANTCDEAAHVPTCGDTKNLQAATCDQNPHIEPVTPFSPDLPDHDPAEPATVVATVAGLTRLAQLPPLPAPKDQTDIWLTPTQVLTLINRYPPRYGDLALGFLARLNLPWYLAPRVLALMLNGYDTGQLARTLAGVHQASHPTAVARWRLDRMILEPTPDHTAWRAPSTYVPHQAPPCDPVAATARGAALARARLRDRGVRA
jgi:hypothetical protein